MADRKRRLSTYPEDSRNAKRQASDAHEYPPQFNPQAERSTQRNATRPPGNQTNAVARSSPRWDSKLRAAIYQAGEDLADFSDHGELVPHAVRPHNETVEDFFSQPLEDMTELWYTGFPIYENYFTQWTPSMFKALRKALHMCHADGAGHDVYLAVLDTKLLSPSNFTVGRAALQKAFDGYLGDIPIRSSSAYLVYGIIGQGAFCARPLKALNHRHVASGLGYRLHHRPLDILKTSLHNASPTLAIDIAREFGKIFDDDGYALPVTAMAIATLCQDRDSSWPDEETLVAEIATALQDHPIQSDWKHDQTIMTAATHTFDQAADRGLRLLRALANRRGMGRAMRAASAVATDLDSLADGMLQVNLAGDMVNGQSVATHDNTSDFEPVSPSSSVTEEFDTPSDDSANTSTALPEGSMDDMTKRLLLNAQKYTPRYLFRGWSNESGGHEGLSTVDAITPLAYLKDREGGASNIYDLTRDQLRDMCTGHLSGFPIETQLSSWASSLQVALYFTYNSPGTYISIIDTRSLQDHNIIVHVPRLVSSGLLDPHGNTYPHEYLAHGVIDGPAHKAVPVSAFASIGIRNEGNWTSPMRQLSEASWTLERQMTAKMVKDAKTVADQYGSSFGTAVLIAIICEKQRSPDLWRSGVGSHDLALVTSAISDYKVPQRLCADDTILKDIVYTENYGDVEQMIRLLRAVVDWRHGKGARGRKQSAKWKDSASLLSEPPAGAEEEASRKPLKRRARRRSRK
ncbi:hypothetical protein HII31_01870 [Pseudocercospora fuligena]|uniref:DUF7587 domain-containing protein n=1 Tax=Pseudocercospora fuligena TaxID=685502 RepID=A0A8H6RTB0_9PEZI|nr:hypothetical protein HII31_01870 [Pseudocercospora fuligena]